MTHIDEPIDAVARRSQVGRLIPHLPVYASHTLSSVNLPAGLKDPAVHPVFRLLVMACDRPAVALKRAHHAGGIP